MHFAYQEKKAKNVKYIWSKWILVVGFKNSCASRGFLFVFYSTPPHESYAISAKTKYKHGLGILSKKGAINSNFQQ